MKLLKSNEGWGYRQLFFISAVLLIFLLIISYYIYSIYSNMGEYKDNTYINLELKLENAAIKYDINHNDTVVTVDKLVEENYLTSFKDNNNNDCNGYVIINKNSYDAYISCDNYTTEKYDYNMEVNIDN